MCRRLALLAAGLLLPAAVAAGEPPAPSLADPLARVAIVKQTVTVGERDGAPLLRKEVLSPVHLIDRIYRSMQGPVTNQQFRLADGGPPELVWVTGYRAVMASPDGGRAVSNEFMCHSNLVLDAKRYQERFGGGISFRDGRLFTLAQGQLEFELPPGFGIPMPSDELLTLNTQVLNHNVEGVSFGVRHRVSIDYVRDRDLARPLRPLVQRGVFGLALVEGPDGHVGLDPGSADVEQHGPGCLPGEDAAGGGHVISDGQGRKLTGFWVVKPGREVNHTRVTPMLGLPYDTAIHAIAVHLHPFAESLALRDLTTGETLFASRARQAEQGIGLAHVESFSSAEGIPVYADHEYELVSVYENTSGVDQDSMAVMYLYLLARDVDVH